MNYLMAFRAGVYGAVVVGAFTLCVGGVFVLLGLIASLFGKAFHKLDDGGNK